MDPDLRNFAVFVNSSASTYKSTAKSIVQIPINGNLASHDPHKLLRVALSQMKFTNSVYNITEKNNTLQICAEFSAGRGYSATDYRRLWQTWTMKIPVGYYNTVNMATILSEKGIIYPEDYVGANAYANRVGYESVQQKFEYAASPPTAYGPGRAAENTFLNVFVGFGAMPADPTDPIQTDGAVSIEINSKVALQSPDLSHLVQLGTDIITPCANILGPNDVKSSGSLDYSMVFRGIHLLLNSETEAFLSTLGFYDSDSLEYKLIPGYHDNQGVAQEMQGFSLYLSPRTVKIQYPDPSQPTLVFDSNTMAYAPDNAVYYVFTTDSDKNATLPVSFLIPPQSVQAAVYGITIGSTSPVLLIKDFLVPDGAIQKYYEPLQGDFLAGIGISIPSPYFVATVNSGSIPVVVPSGTGNIIRILKVDWNANNDYGIEVGYTIRPILYNQPGNASNCIGRHIVNIDLTDPTYVDLTLDSNITRSGGVASQDWEWNTYTLSSAQTIQYDPTTIDFSLMIISPTVISSAAALLRPALLANLEGLDEVHVHCPQLRTQHFSSTSREPLAPSDVIAVIPVDATFGSKMTYQPPVTLESYLNNTNIVNLEFRLTDSNNNLLNFNGVDWSLVLKCDEVEVATDTQLNTSGFLNTPFQDQLNVLEGTALQQLRAHKGKLPYEFYESNKKHKSNPNNRYFNK